MVAVETRFTEVTGVGVPVQQAPMSSVSNPALAVAVADAGGVGSVTAQGMAPARVDEVLAGMAASTTGILAANFLTGQIDPEAVAAAAARVRIVDFYWADPDPALVAADAGCDVVAVQGTEAGGHIRGRSPLRPLLDAVLNRVGLPVLAAGGIGDARAFAAVLAAGADGARAGTRFVATDESGAHPAYKQAIAAAATGSEERRVGKECRSRWSPDH